ncbi:hypothetical protein HK405_013731 [Cladochytrium tenue]|nr:hypothetical protein HK405_013731 [Cladochytrium tenue]
MSTTSSSSSAASTASADEIGAASTVSASSYRTDGTCSGDLCLPSAVIDAVSSAGDFTRWSSSPGGSSLCPNVSVATSGASGATFQALTYETDYVCTRAQLSDASNAVRLDAYSFWQNSSAVAAVAQLRFTWSDLVPYGDYVLKECHLDVNNHLVQPQAAIYKVDTSSSSAASTATSAAGDQSSSDSSSAGSSAGLTGGAVAGIVIAAIVVLAVGGVVALRHVNLRRRAALRRAAEVRSYSVLSGEH